MNLADYDLVVIGSGPAGQKGAIAAAKAGRRVALVDRAVMMGGVSVHTGTIPSKTLHEAIFQLTGSTVKAPIHWLNGLPATETVTAIVSLLGRKPEPAGQSEFSYYSFRSVHEDRPGSPTFQEWLDRETAPGKYVVIEHPTTDTRPISLPDK